MTQNSFVVSAQYLSENLDNPQVVIVDCRFALTEPELGYQQYQISHIPGAYYLDLNKDLSSPVERHGGRHPLPNTTELAKKIAAMGIKFQETLVVAYDNSRFGFGARLWWLLRYMGHDKVTLLNGGWTAWESAGYPLSDAIPTPRPGSFRAQLNPDWVVNIETVKESLSDPGVVIVDSRERDRFLGKREPIDPIADCIPTAVNYPWQDVTNDQGELHSLEELQKRWSDIQSSKEIIVYCGSGVTACVNLLSLEVVGISGAKLYAGGWSDWCSYLQ